MKCPFCGAQIADDCLFCTECGKELPKNNACPHCGASVNEDDVFCTECGKKVEEEKSQSSEQEHAATNSPHYGVEQSQLVQQKNSNKRKRSWIIGAILLLGVIVGIGIYFFSRIGSDSDSKDAKVFLEGMYKDFYEPGTINRLEEAYLSKYFTKDVMRKFYVEDSYAEAEEGTFLYYTDFLIHGVITGGASPDYGDKVVSRAIEPESDGWFLVTNIWDVIQKPVRVHLKVKPVDGSIKIVDIKLEDDDEFEIDAE